MRTERKENMDKYEYERILKWRRKAEKLVMETAKQSKVPEFVLDISKCNIMKCTCCGAEFIPTKDMHSIVVNENASGNGLSALIGTKETNIVKYYDAYDCPNCGRQLIVGERLMYGKDI